jgi:hypothetical protein
VLESPPPIGSPPSSATLPVLIVHFGTLAVGGTGPVPRHNAGVHAFDGGVSPAGKAARIGVMRTHGGGRWR